MSKWTKDRLAEAIYTEVESSGGELLKACRKVIKRIGNSGQAKPFLDDLGPALLIYFEREWCRRESPERPACPTPSNYGRNLKAEAATIARAMVAIGNTGLRKPIGQLTADDCLVIADYHHALEQANRAQRIGWQSVAEELPDEATVADAMDGLSDSSRAFIRSVARVQVEAVPIETEDEDVHVELGEAA